MSLRRTRLTLRRRILSILRRAAGPHTKLLLVDNLLPYACVDDKADLDSSSQGAVRSLVPEGSPLLPNLGKASANGYILDISVRPPTCASRAAVLIQDDDYIDAWIVRRKGAHLPRDGRSHTVRRLEDH